MKFYPFINTLFTSIIITNILCYPPNTPWKGSPFTYDPGTHVPQYTTIDDESGSIIMYTTILDSTNKTVTIKRWDTSGTPTLLVSKDFTYTLAILDPTVIPLNNYLLYSYSVPGNSTHYVSKLNKADLL